MRCKRGHEMNENGRCIKKCKRNQYRNVETNRCNLDRNNECPPGYEISSRSGRCVKQCKSTEFRNKDTGRCNTSKKSSTRQQRSRRCGYGYELNDRGNCVKECEDDQRRNPKTGRCQKSNKRRREQRDVLDNECRYGYELNDRGNCVKKCDNDQYRNVETGRCRLKSSQREGRNVRITSRQVHLSPRIRRARSKARKNPCPSGFSLNRNGYCVKTNRKRPNVVITSNPLMDVRAAQRAIANGLIEVQQGRLVKTSRSKQRESVEDEEVVEVDNEEVGEEVDDLDRPYRAYFRPSRAPSTKLRRSQKVKSVKEAERRQAERTIEKLVGSDWKQYLPRGYKVGKELGAGRYGVTFSLCTGEDNQCDQAMKFIRKPPDRSSKTWREEVEEEFKMAKTIGRKGLAPAVISTKQQYTKSGKVAYFIMNRINRSLRDWMRESRNNAELDQKVKQMIKLFDSFHKAGYRHGDPHDDNIVVVQSSLRDPPVLKFIDFGFTRGNGGRALKAKDQLRDWLWFLRAGTKYFRESSKSLAKVRPVFNQLSNSDKKAFVDGVNKSRDYLYNKVAIHVINSYRGLLNSRQIRDLKNLRNIRYEVWERDFPL